jgi:L-threonylcarbamoyladenylate synthase
VAIFSVNSHNIVFLAKQLKKGMCVAIPTETVYGLAACCDQPEAIEKIYQIKKRPKSHPLIVHVGPSCKSTADLIQKQILFSLSQEQQAQADRLIREFWPGPLSLILPKGKAISSAATDQQSVAVRMPAVEATLDLIEATGQALVAPSANLYTQLSPTSAQMVQKNLAVDWILDAGTCKIGIESTILNCMQSPPRILRPGAISQEQIAACLGSFVIDFQPEHQSEIKTSGQEKAHYQPTCRLVVLNNRLDQLSETERQTLEDQIQKKRVALLVSDPSRFNAAKRFQHPHLFLHALAKTLNEKQIAQNLFAKLDALSKEWIEVIVVEPFSSDSSFAKAIQDRLNRAHQPFEK